MNERTTAGWQLQFITPASLPLCTPIHLIIFIHDIITFEMKFTPLKLSVRDNKVPESASPAFPILYLCFPPELHCYAIISQNYGMHITRKE